MDDEDPQFSMDFLFKSPRRSESDAQLYPAKLVLIPPDKMAFDLPCGEDSEEILSGVTQVLENMGYNVTIGEAQAGDEGVLHKRVEIHVPSYMLAK